MLPLKLYTLGGLSFSLGDQPLQSFTTRKVDALLVYLACERREHTREWLADLLWDDVSQERALGNLRTALVSLNRQLADYLVITRQTLKINPAVDCWVDAQALTSALASNGITRDVTAALALYKGDFLAGFHLRGAVGFETWQAAESERLRSAVIAALDRLIAEALDHDVPTSGIAYAQRLVTLDPLNDAAHRQLMLLYARAGQRSAALAQYETYVKLLADELGVDPEAETSVLFEQIKSDQLIVSVTSSVSKVHLPSMATLFIERARDLARIVERLRQPDCRLLTLVGAGGIGKTRLAVRAAAEIAGDYRDGVYFVGLVAVQQGEFLPAEIANSLNFTLQGGDPRGELIEYLARRELLLVLDNFEHLVDHAGLIADILSHAPQVQILVTSRVWLNLHEEWMLVIDGMDVPTFADQDAEQYSAVQLFNACARRAQADFSLSDQLETVVKICQMVEGMPLSIELAASWLRVIPAAEIARSIDLKFLAANIRNLPERHRSVEAVFEYSWDLLPPATAAVLTKLAVFRGVFDRDAAVQVAGASVTILASLLEHSLIRRIDDTYYTIHELLSQFAFKRLSDADSVRDAHLNYYVELTANTDSRIHGRQQTQWLDRLECEHNNLCAAISWSLEQGRANSLELGLSLAASIWEFWLMRGHLSEGRQWLTLLLQATQGVVSTARGAATQGAGYLAWIQGEHDQAEALHQEGLAIREAVGDKAGMGGSLSNLGVIAWSRGNFAAARSYYERAYAARREADYTLGMASVLNNLSLLMQDQCIYDEAIAYGEQAWALFKELDDLQGMVHVLYNLGAMTYDQGEPARALSIQQEALGYAQQLGDPRIIGGLLQNLGHTLMSLGDLSQARAYLDQSLALVSQVADKQHIGLVQRGFARLALLDGRIDAAQTAIDLCLAALRQSKGDIYLGQALLTQGDILRAQANLAAAESVYREALSLLLKVNRPQPVAEALYGLGGILFERGMAEQSAVLLSAADGIAQRFNLRFPTPPEGIDRAAVSESLSPDTLDHAAKTGASMDFAALARYLKLVPISDDA